MADPILSLPHRRDRSIDWWQTRWFAVAAVLAAAIPLLWPALPPFTDLPGHVGRYRVMLDGGEGPLARYFLFEWRWTGNLGVDLIVAALGPVIGLEPAVKLAVLSIPMLTVAAILALSRELHGRVSPFALFALPLVYSFALHFGFINYTLSMALALGGVAMWLHLGRLGRIRQRALLAIPFSFLLWTTHIVGWGMMSILVFAVQMAGRGDRDEALPDRTIRAALSCLPLAGPMILILMNTGSGGGVIGPFLNLEVKLHGVVGMMRDRWLWADVTMTGLLVAILYAAGRGAIGRMHPVAAWMTGIGAAAFLLMPFMLMGSAFADVRLLPYLFIIALVGVDPIHTRPTTAQVVAVAGLAFCLIRLAMTTASLVQIDREWQRELAAIDAMPRGASVMAMVTRDCGEPWGLPRLTHLPGIAMARRGVFVNSQWPMAGAPLMRLRTDRPGPFDTDPSQVVLSAPCTDLPTHLTLSDAVARFPRHRFTHLWLIRPHLLRRDQLAGMTRVWTNGQSHLFRIDR
ncbi:hypothetical protein ACPVPU_12100 [Sphingomonas sp. CJ99]